MIVSFIDLSYLQNTFQVLQHLRQSSCGKILLDLVTEIIICGYAHEGKTEVAKTTSILAFENFLMADFVTFMFVACFINVVFYAFKKADWKQKFHYVKPYSPYMDCQ